jgi:hypothetical protein
LGNLVYQPVLLIVVLAETGELVLVKLGQKILLGASVVLV